MRRVPPLSFLFALCFLLPFVSAAGGYYTGWVYPGDTFTANGTLYALEAGTDPYQLLLHEGSEQYVLRYGECTYAEDGLRRYCYTNSDYIACVRGAYDCPSDNDDCCPYDVSHIRYDAGRANYAGYLSLEHVVPAVTVQRKAEKASLKVDEATAITLTFENTGEDAISGARYVEYLPEGFVVTAAQSELVRGDKTLTLALNIAPGTTKAYKYSLKPIDYVSGAIRGNLTYAYKGAARAVSSSALSLSVPSPFAITHAIKPTSAVVGDDATFTYSLKNTDGKEAMDATATFATTLFAEPLPGGVKRSGDAYAWSGTLDAGETETLVFSLATRMTGKAIVTTTTEMEVGAETFTHKVQDAFTVSAQPLVPILRAPTSVAGGTNATVRLLLNNTASSSYRKVTALLVAGDLTRTIGVERVLPGEVPLIAELVLEAPNVSAETTWPLVFNGTYESDAGERFTFARSASVKLTPGGSPYLVTQKPNRTTIHPDEVLAVTVTVKNLGAAYATVAVTDLLPSAAFVQGGLRQKEMSLKAGEEREAYTYQVTVPSSFDGDVFTLTTQVFDKETGKRYEQQTSVKVVAPDRPAAANATNATAPVAPAAPVAPQEEETGGWRAFWNDVKSFFGKLFG